MIDERIGKFGVSSLSAWNRDNDQIGVIEKTATLWAMQTVWLVGDCARLEPIGPQSDCRARRRRSQREAHSRHSRYIGDARKGVAPKQFFSSFASRRAINGTNNRTSTRHLRIISPPQFVIGLILAFQLCQIKSRFVRSCRRSDCQSVCQSGRQSARQYVCIHRTAIAAHRATCLAHWSMKTLRVANARFDGCGTKRQKDEGECNLATLQILFDGYDILVNKLAATSATTCHSKCESNLRRGSIVCLVLSP